MKNVAYIILTLVLFAGCKKLELEIEETKCKKMKLKRPRYELVPSKCGTSNKDFAVDVTFDFDGDPDCIHLIDVEASVKNSSGFNMPEVNAFEGQLLASEDKVTVSQSGTATFHYCYSLSSVADTANLGFIRLNWHTENDLENESNQTGIRINFNTNTGTSDPSTYQNTYSTQTKVIQLKVWDNADQDGDVISINHNGTWINENLMITNGGTILNLTLTPGHNYINFYAVNQGSSGPNTLSAQLMSGGAVFGSFTLDSNTGETKSISVQYNP